MTRTTPELALPNFRVTPKGGCLTTTYDLRATGPIHGGIFSGIGFERGDPCVRRIPTYDVGFLNQHNLLARCSAFREIGKERKRVEYREKTWW
ncbi:hypothetical protein AVEN_155352-1 [Araneus ventricosus]|uniref:Uncharacterized protein n=1 Tax=Araneus ventricosus TaxID=182803 RepID=A0A4Y2LXB6_ARAVE|nr:hypothetical protein AVEN_155352-1 [Araneus ventricosus]